jgi:hypothetical protein
MRLEINRIAAAHQNILGINLLNMMFTTCITITDIARAYLTHCVNAVGLFLFVVHSMTL